MLRGRCSWNLELEFVRIKSWTLFQWRAGSARPAPGCVSAQEPSQLPGNFPFPSHNSRLGSCGIPGTPEPVGLQDGNTRHHRTLGWLLLVHSFTIHLIHTWHCSSTGGRRHFKHPKERIPPGMFQKGRNFPHWTSNKEAEPCLVPEG